MTGKKVQFLPNKKGWLFVHTYPLFRIMRYATGSENLTKSQLITLLEKEKKSSGIYRNLIPRQDRQIAYFKRMLFGQKRE